MPLYIDNTFSNIFNTYQIYNGNEISFTLFENCSSTENGGAILGSLIDNIRLSFNWFIRCSSEKLGGACHFSNGKTALIRWNCILECSAKEEISAMAFNTKFTWKIRVIIWNMENSLKTVSIANKLF